MENKLIYLPAVMPSIGLYNKTKNGYVTNFWDKEKSPFYYPHMLVSAYYGKNSSDFRKDFGIGKDVFILGDSGGFQKVTQPNIIINPKHILEWQEKQCDSGLILDYPPYEFTGTAQFGSTKHDTFKKRLAETKANSKYSLENRKNCKIYGVIQGDGYEQMKEWYDELHSLETTDKKFDGWALSPKPSNNLYKIALFGCFAMEEKINTPIHILQIGSIKATIVAAYIRRKRNICVTMDNSSFKLASRYGWIEDPVFIGNKYNVGEKRETKLRFIKGNNICMCPICSKLGIKNVDNLSPTDYKFLDLHNLYHIVRYVHYIDNLDDINFMKILNKFSPIVKDAIQMIDDYLEKGMGLILEKYKHKLNIEEKQNKQASLFDS